MHSIALIGAGQLGSRHLQGLAKLTLPCEITIVDPSPASLALARQRFDELPANAHVTAVRFVASIEALPPRLDYAIVATAADVRLAVLRSLLAHATVRHILLEKVLFQRAADYPQASALFQRHGVEAWVNCPRRLYPIAAAIREFFAGQALRRFDVVGGGWGLGCNGIHFLDLLGWLTRDVPSELSIDGLDRRLRPSKRAGFMEFTGSLRGCCGTTRFELASLGDSSARLLFTLRSDTRTCLVDEAAGLAFFLDQAGSSWRTHPFSNPLVSELSTAIARDVLAEGRCGLASYEQSVAYHLPFLAALTAHARDVQGTPADLCPIT